MHTDEPTFDALEEVFEQDFDLEALAAARTHVPAYWDAHDGALVHGTDPDELRGSLAA